MKKIDGKKITIDDLAGMMKRSFDSTDKKIAEGFKKVNDRLDTVVEKHDEEVKSLTGKVRVLEDALEI